MNPQELRDAIAWLDACLNELVRDAEGHVRTLNDDEQTRFDEGLALREQYARDLERHETIARLAQLPGHTERATDTPALIVRDDPYDLDNVRVGLFSSAEERGNMLRDNALRAIEATRSLAPEQQEQAEAVTRRHGAAVAERVLLTGNRAYRRAFQKVYNATGQGRMASLDAEEAAAMERAAGLSNAAGGFAVPFMLDPTVILTQAGSLNPFRRVCHVTTTTANVWHGLTSGGITASWDAEAAEVSDDTPTLTQPSITCQKGQAFVPYSVEIGADWPDFESEMRRELSDAKDQLEASAFATGSGSQPQGIVTGLTAGAIQSATQDTLAVADVYTTYEAPGERWLSDGVWFANRKIYDKIRQFATANNYHAYWVELGAGIPPLLMGRPAYIASGMSGTITALANNYVLIYGDPSQFYIVDRVGVSVEMVPHLFGTANGRPTGQRGILMWWRVGSAVVNTGAFGMLNC